MNCFNPCDLPVIDGKNVSLRPITAEDTELIVRWRNDPEVVNNFIFRGPFTAELHRRWLETKVASGEVVQYIILAGEEREPVGSVYFRDVNPEFESAEYGIFIGEAAWRGRGVGSETARLFCDFGFGVIGLHRIGLRVLDGNRIARRTYEKVGFREEGVFRDMVKLDGRFRDVVFMSKLNGEEE